MASPADIDKELEQLQTVAGAHAVAMSVLFDTLKAKHVAQGEAEAAKAQAEAALQPAADAINQLTHYMETGTSNIHDEIAALTAVVSQQADALAASPAPS